MSGFNAVVVNRAVSLVEPRQHLGHAPDLMPCRQWRPRHHQHRQAQRARRVQLGLRAAAACVLADDKIDLVFTHQGDVARQVEGAARDDGGVLPQRRQLVRLIDQPQDVVMLWLRREDGQVHAAQGQQHALRRAAERRSGGRHIGHGLPTVSGAWQPRRARQRQQGNAGMRAGRDGVGAHACRKGMGGIHQVSHLHGLQIAHQTGDATEATDAHGNRLRSGLRHAPGIRQHGALAVFVAFGQRQRQRAGFGRATQDQDIAHG